MKETGIRIVKLVFMSVALQRWDITAISITVDLTVIGKGSMGKFPHGYMLDIGCYPHFQKAGIASFIQRKRRESLRFFCTLPRFLPTVGPPKYASSNSMAPHSRWGSSCCTMVMRMRLSMDQAVLWIVPRIAVSWTLEMPHLSWHTKWNAKNHCVNGIWVLCNNVPAVTEA